MTINASESVEMSKVHVLGSGPKNEKLKLVSSVTRGGITALCFSPVSASIVSVVPRTFSLWTTKCITWPPWIFSRLLAFHEPDVDNLFPSPSVGEQAIDLPLALVGNYCSMVRHFI